MSGPYLHGVALLRMLAEIGIVTNDDVGKVTVEATVNDVVIVRQEQYLRREQGVELVARIAAETERAATGEDEPS